MTQFNVGDRVINDQYGEGTVIRYEDGSRFYPGYETFNLVWVEFDTYVFTNGTHINGLSRHKLTLIGSQDEYLFERMQWHYNAC